jgi:hypothetical protein
MKFILHNLIPNPFMFLKNSLTQKGAYFKIHGRGGQLSTPTQDKNKCRSWIVKKSFTGVGITIILLTFLLSVSLAQTTSLLPFQGSIVLTWNDVALQAVSLKARKVPATARDLYLLHQAMYDAWSLYDATAQPVYLDAAIKRPSNEHTEANQAAAVSQAAFTILVSLFSEFERASQRFSTTLEELGYAPYSSGENTPEYLGFLAAQTVLSERRDDGSNQKKDYLDVTSSIYPNRYTFDTKGDPNLWHRLTVPTGLRRDETGKPIVIEEDLLSFQVQRFTTPHWGAVTPFALTSGDDFRPGPPPHFGSDEPYTDALGVTMTNDEAFHEQVLEIWTLSQTLSDEQRVIAEYWSDGPRTPTPPGHWNLLAQGISVRDKHTLGEDVRMFFALNAALFDAGIACWDAKRAYNSVRPIEAVQQLFDESWHPYQSRTFVTPPFPEYVSGHSTFSAAAAEVLTRFTGSNQFYDGVTVLPKDVNRDGKLDLLGQYIAVVGSSKLTKGGPLEAVTLQWETFQEAADEAGMSRRYGGIHFQDGDLRGRELGKKVGTVAYEKAEGYWLGE